MQPKTIEQKPGGDVFAKARELIEIRGSEDLTLQDRRIINLLYANASEGHVSIRQQGKRIIRTGASNSRTVCL